MAEKRVLYGSMEITEDESTYRDRNMQYNLIKIWKKEGMKKKRK